MEANIHFFSEDIEFSLEHQSVIEEWIQQVIAEAGQSINEINYIFCSDDYLLQINQDFLDHDYYTDIITFDNREEEEEEILADIFISVDRVQDNAAQLKQDLRTELHRVMIHGIHHLLGQGDKTEAEKSQMREREEASLSLLKI